MRSRHRVEHFIAVATAYAKKGLNLLPQVVSPCYIRRRRHAIESPVSFAEIPFGG
jgi:hypothetical protein